MNRQPRLGLDPHVHRLAIYMEGALGQDIGKMGYGVLRYSPCEVICVIDSSSSAASVSDVIDCGRNVSVVASLQEAAEAGANVLVLGTAPPGGRIPESWHSALTEAVNRGMSLVNGLHESLATRFIDLLPGQFVWDIRQEPQGISTGTGAAMHLLNKRILMVGSDMAVGKMTAGLELWKTARANGVTAAFVATGQIGITVTGGGVPLDAIRVDYASGAIEAEVIRVAHADWIIIEGQGSICHPGSTATLPLLRGSMPTDLVLCCKAGQTHLRRMTEIAIPALRELADLYQALACACGSFPAAKVRAVAVNTAEVAVQDVQHVLDEITQSVGVPAFDPIRPGGAQNLFTVLADANS